MTIVTYCASDMHLGYEHANYEKTMQFFNRVEEKADELILCGDIFDLWRYPVKKIGKSTMAQFNDTIEIMKRVTKEVPTMLIKGNHDYQLGKLLGRNREGFKFIISDSFYRDNTYFTHGWQFSVRQKFGSFAYGWLTTRFPYIYQRFFKKPSETVQKRDYPSELSIKTHEKANSFAIQNHIDRIVMGHTHIPLIKHNVVNCGDFVDSCSYVIIKNGKEYEIAGLNYI